MLLKNNEFNFEQSLIICYEKDQVPNYRVNHPLVLM